MNRKKRGFLWYGLAIFLFMKGEYLLSQQLHYGLYSNQLTFSASSYVTGASTTFSNVDGTDVDFAFAWDVSPPGLTSSYDNGYYSGLSNASFWITSGLGANTYTMCLNLSGSDVVTELAFDLVHVNWPGSGGGDKVTIVAKTQSGATITPDFTEPASQDYSISGTVLDANDYDFAPEYNLGVNLVASLADPIVSVCLSWEECSSCSAGGHGVGIGDIDFNVNGDDGCAETKITLDLTFDDYPEETSWVLKDASNTTIASGGTYGYFPDDSTFTQSFCLGEGDYTFTISDSYGDGICCSYGSGAYSLTDETGTVLASGGSFGSSESASFSISSDTDGDGIPDSQDPDDDGDGISDRDEGYCQGGSDTYADAYAHNGVSDYNNADAEDGSYADFDQHNDYVLFDFGQTISSGDAYQIVMRKESGESGNYAPVIYESIDGTWFYINSNLQSVSNTSFEAIEYTASMDFRYLWVMLHDSYDPTDFDVDAVKIAGANCSHRDTDGDGTADYLDLDSDNDGLTDATECTASFSYSGGDGGSTHTITLDDAAGCTIDMTTMDNSFQISLNGTNIHSANLQGESGALLSGEVYLLFSDGDYAWSTWVANTNGLPRVRITIDSSGAVSYYATRYSSSTALEMMTPDGGSANSLSWQSGTNTLVITNLDGQGPDGISGTVHSVIFDTDTDGVADYLDLDSENDGIFDGDEAGHSQSLNATGRIDGADVGSGSNGLYDGVESYAESGTINYTVKDSDSDSSRDAIERDADNDSCYDTQECAISDADEDGIAGSGSPSVNANGRVSGITYSSPTNANWQNAAQSPACNSVCDQIKTNRRIPARLSN